MPLIETSDLKFYKDKYYTCQLKIPNIDPVTHPYNGILVQLVDELYACEEELSEEYKEKIVKFLNSYEIWYPNVLNELKRDENKDYHIADSELELLYVYILFEQNEVPLFGAGFHSDLYQEHGIGVIINGDTLDILEVGEYDIAFCGGWRFMDD